MYSIVLKQVLFSKKDFDKIISSKDKKSDIFIKNKISDLDFKNYLNFQLNNIFRLVGKNQNPSLKIKTRIDKKLESSLKNIHNISESLRSVNKSSVSNRFKEQDNFSHHKKSIFLPSNELNQMEMTEQSASKRLIPSLKEIKVKSEKKNPESNFWRKFKKNINKTVYEDIVECKNIRINNLIFEIGYFQNRGAGVIDDYSDSFPFLSDNSFMSHSFLKNQLQNFERDYFEIAFEKEESMMINQLNMMSQSKNHEHLGVFHSTNKNCILCDNSKSPFDFLNSVQVLQSQQDVYLEQFKNNSIELTKICNKEMKETFVLSCSFWGPNFKPEYLNHLKGIFK